MTLDELNKALHLAAEDYVTKYRGVNLIFKKTLRELHNEYAKCVRSLYEEYEESNDGTRSEFRVGRT